MTTGSQRPTPSGRARRSTGRPAVLGAAAACAGAVAIVTIVAAIVSGGVGAAGAAIGSGITLATFLIGALVVDLVATSLPAAALPTAMMIYTTQVGLLAVFFLVMNDSGQLDVSVSRAWLGTGVIVASVAWMAAQSVVVLKQRIPVYDLDDPVGEK